jgi:rare lipoprotein A
MPGGRPRRQRGRRFALIKVAHYRTVAALAQNVIIHFAGELLAAFGVVRPVRTGDQIMTKWLLCVAVSSAMGIAMSISAHAGAPRKSALAATYSMNGRKTASGEAFSASKLTAAHRSLPFGTLVRVTNLRNGRTVVVRINDRGPFSKGRVIDLTPAAARQLGFTGLVPVALDVVAGRHAAPGRIPRLVSVSAKSAAPSGGAAPTAAAPVLAPDRTGLHPVPKTPS